MIDDDQIYIVVDIEADGPAVGLHSMLSLAAVASSPTHEMGRFYKKLQPLPGATPDSDTAEWWSRYPEAWEEVCTDQEPPQKVMQDFCNWVISFEKQPILVANPVSLDYTFISWYLFRYAHNPFMDKKNAIYSIDLLSFTSGKYNRTFNNSRRAKLPTLLDEGAPRHSHRAIDDAVGHAVRLRNILRTPHLPKD